MNNNFVSWRRVSTFKQGRSGLGLEAQKEIIRYFIERDNGNWLADYEECYTGKELSGCAELRKAIEHAKREHATLIIAKSDRFRNTAEALKIYEEMGDGNIMFCDLPTSDKFSLTLFFALAEREALLVSIRTKQALAVKKAQGAQLGASNSIYRMNYKLKSDEEKKEISMKKGMAKNERFLSSKDVTAFLKVLKRQFPVPCESEDPSEWNWKQIGTKGDNCRALIGIMKDYHSMDDSGTLFKRWHFNDWNEDNYQLNICTLIYRIKRALNTSKNHKQ